MMRQGNFFTVALTTMSILIGAGRAGADWLDATRDQPLVETKHAVKVIVERGHATLEIRRSYDNQGKVAEQLELIISLPEEAVATGLRIRGQDEWYEGELMEADMAAVVYESLTGYGPWKVHDPAILFWNDLGELSLWMFPINPGVESTVEYTLTQPLDYRDGKYYLRYPAAVDQIELAVPEVRVVSKNKKAPVWVNGKKVVQGKSVPMGVKIIDGEELEWYASATDCEMDEWDEYWVEEHRFCPVAGEALISIEAPKIDTVEARYGAYALTDGRWVVRLEIDSARTLRPRPKKASVVFVIDGSHTFGEEGIDAALEFASAYIKHLPDARYEVVMFRNRPARLLDDFVPASDWPGRVGKADPMRLEPGNGSHLDEGLRIAASILAPRKGPKRIVAITDSIMRSSYENKYSRKSLETLHADAIVHLVDLSPGPKGQFATAERDDGHDLAPVPLGHGGIAVTVWEGRTKKDYLDAARELVRPSKIDNFLVYADGDLFEELDQPETLPEGKGLRWMFITEEEPRYVTLEGRIWAEPFSRIVPIDQDYSYEVVPALVFSTDLFWDLDDTGMMAAAAAGSAVSPVTSYLSIEPGVRPSTEGLVRDGALAGGGLGSFGTGCLGSGIGSGYGTGSKPPEPDYAVLLREQARKASAPCFDGQGTGEQIDAWIETTHREIVDVKVYADGGDLETCIDEAIWAIRLHETFEKKFRFQFKEPISPQ